MQASSFSGWWVNFGSTWKSERTITNCVSTFFLRVLSMNFWRRQYERIPQRQVCLLMTGVVNSVSKWILPNSVFSATSFAALLCSAATWALTYGVLLCLSQQNSTVQACRSCLLVSSSFPGDSPLSWPGAYYRCLAQLSSGILGCISIIWNSYFSHNWCFLLNIL